jgi:hypothetical protein
VKPSATQKQLSQIHKVGKTILPIVKVGASLFSTLAHQREVVSQQLLEVDHHRILVDSKWIR